MTAENGWFSPMGRISFRPNHPTPKKVTDVSWLGSYQLSSHRLLCYVSYDGSRMFRPKTVSAHCVETSISAIVEVPKHLFRQSLKFGRSVPKHPFLQSCAETSCAETSVLTYLLYIILELFVLLAYYLRCLSFHCNI